MAVINVCVREHGEILCKTGAKQWDRMNSRSMVHLVDYAGRTASSLDRQYRLLLSSRYSGGELRQDPVYYYSLRL